MLTGTCCCPGVVRNYGKMLVELASVVPDGIVCFFVSYLYMDQIVTSWHEMGILQEVRSPRHGQLLPACLR